MPPPDIRYAEPVAASNFSFLRGASHPQDLVATALALDHAGIGIADRNSVAGVVRAHGALEELRREGAVPPEKVRNGSSPGEYDWMPPPTAEAGATNAEPEVGPGCGGPAAPARAGFPAGGRRPPGLCRRHARHRGLSREPRGLGPALPPADARQRAGRKGECILALDDLTAVTDGLLLVVMPGRRLEPLPALLERLDEVTPGALWLAASMHRRGDDHRRLARLRRLAAARRLPLLATGDVLYATPDQRDLQDVLSCIREGTSVTAAGRRLEVNAERHLKPPAEMVRLFRDAPEAVAETIHFFDRIGFRWAS